jgi:HK97 family phage major capsid protein
MNALELRRTRSETVAQMRRLVTETNGRALTEAEQREWDALDLRQGRLAETIQAAEPDVPSGRQFAGDRDGLAALEADLSKSTGTKAAKRQDDPPTGEVVEGRILGPRESFRSYVQAQAHRSVDPELAKVSFGQLVRAMVLGPQSAVEQRALAEGADVSGGVTVPEITAAQLIDKLRARLVLTRLGALTIPLESDKTTIARMDTDPLAAWRLENSVVAESDPTFSGVVFQPKTLAVLVKASRELVEDSLNITTALENAFAQSMAVELDRVALQGSGTPPEPQGLRTMAGVHEASGATLTNYDSIIDLMTLVAGANATTTGIVMHPRTAGTLAKLKDTQTNPMGVPSMLEGIPMEATTAVSITEAPGTTSSLYLGQWNELMFGIRATVRVEVLRERYADYLQYGFLAYLRADVAVAHPASFGRLISIAAA